MTTRRITRQNALHVSAGFNREVQSRIPYAHKLNDLSNVDGYVEMRDLVVSKPDTTYAVISKHEIRKSSDTEVEQYMRNEGNLDMNIDKWVKYSCDTKSLTDYRKERESPRLADRVYSDTDSIAMSVCDQARYSDSLKEFENMVKTCTAQGEYVYLSQMNGTARTTNTSHSWDSTNEPQYAKINKVSKGDKSSKNGVNVSKPIIGIDVNRDTDQGNTQINDIDDEEINKLDKKDNNGNLLVVSDHASPSYTDDAEDDIKKIIQECLWYFHSQVEGHRSKGQIPKSTVNVESYRKPNRVEHNHSQSQKHNPSKKNPPDEAPRSLSQNAYPRTDSHCDNNQKSFIQIDRKYRPASGHVMRAVRPRSLTDSGELPSHVDPRRPRSLTESELKVPTDHQHVQVDWTYAGKDTYNTGDGMSMVSDVSSVSSRHGTQQQTRVHTLPPRAPADIATPPGGRLDKRENSIRRQPHITRRSKSAFGMSVSSTEPLSYSKQNNHVTTGRMFIEDVLNDISDPNGFEKGDTMTSSYSSDVIKRDTDNNEIKITQTLDNVRVPLIPNGPVTPLIRSVSDFKGTSNDKHFTNNNGFKHFKSLSSGAKSFNTLPNFTKDSKFLRSLSKQGNVKEVTNTTDNNNSALKSDESANTSSDMLDNGLGVYDIVGEDSGCLYPWQRDVSTQYEPVVLLNEETKSVCNNRPCDYIEETRDSDAKTNQGINKSGDTIVKRQRVFRATRPHSVGCIDTASFEADLEIINDLQNSARARRSEPFLHNTSHRRWPSQSHSDEMGSASNLESILENPAEITLKHSAHRNVLSSPSVSPELFRDPQELDDGRTEAADSDDPVFESPVGKRRKPSRHRSSGSITSGSEDSDHEPSQPLARRGRRSAIVDTKNCGDVSPTTLSPEASPYNSSDEGDNASGRSGRRRSSGTNLSLNVYPGDLLVQEHHKKLIKRNTIADFYSGRNGSTPNLTDDNKKQRPFSLLKLMKTRSKESLAQLSDMLQTLKPTEFKDNNLAAYKNVHWTDLVASTDKQGSTGDLRNISPVERKRRESVWELFKSECVFLIDHLMVLKNCFLEPLKKLQVEGFLMYTEPSEIFSNLEDLCYVSYTFCKDFIGSLVKDMSATDFGRTSVLIKALQRFSAHSKDGSVYHTYCLNYSNALTYLEKLRKSDDFCEFEKWCEQDPRCNRLQLADLLIGPMQHCTKLPLLLHNIKKYTEDPLEKRQVAESIDKVESSLEQLEDKMKWLKNFERVQEIQRQLVWPTVSDLDPRAFIPDHLKSKLMRQPCARLLACPTRQLLHEGTITLTETTKTIDAYMFLFDDILLLTKMKKRKQKQTSGENMNAPQNDIYTVHRQPLALDRLCIHDLTNQEAAASGMKFAFVLVQISRFQQIIDVFTLQSPTELIKNAWLSKIKKAKAQFNSVSRASSVKEDANSNSITGKSYHGKSKSIDTEYL